VFDFNLRGSYSNIFSLNAKGLALSVSSSSSFQPHSYSHSLSWWCKTLQDKMKKKSSKSEVGITSTFQIVGIISNFLNVRIVIVFQFFI
jgi:hypothetical protein